MAEEVKVVSRFTFPNLTVRAAPHSVVSPAYPSA